MLKLILNWLKIPFQIRLFQDPPNTVHSVKPLPLDHIVMSPDSRIAYYSDTLSQDGFNHDTNNQLVNHCIYMYLYNDQDEVKRSALGNFVYSNLHGGNWLSNGISWDLDGIHYAGLNTSTETISALNLILSTNANENISMRESYEKLIYGMLDNNLSMNLICNPGGEIGKKYQEALEQAGYRQEKVKVSNPETSMDLGCSPDKAITLLATLMVLIKLYGNKNLQKTYDYYHTKCGYGLKAYLVTNSFTAISSLKVLSELSTDKKYEKILKRKLQNDNESSFNNFIYSKLLGVKDV